MVIRGEKEREYTVDTMGLDFREPHDAQQHKEGEQYTGDTLELDFREPAGYSTA